VGFSWKRVDVVSLFTEEVPQTKAFYREVLGLPLTFEDQHSAVFRLENLMLNLVDEKAAADLIEPVEPAGSDAGSRVVLAMFVDDVDEACADLAKVGVSLLNGPVDRPWGVRTASFSDPAGHIWEIAQELN
jgi:catechol 2,3-dioxygenase-like lactoylglutathione lyase family enzyme